MRLSIVIVNWNTTDLLEACLRSITKYPFSADYGITVVDNASDSFDEARFRELFPGVKLIASKENTGYARGNNIAIETSPADYYLLLNPDTEVTEVAINALVEFMEQHPDAGAAGAKLLRPNGEIDRSVRSFPYPGPIAWEFTGLSRFFTDSSTFGAYRMTSFNYDRVAEVDQPMGSCLILNGRAVREIGLFDEEFPIFFNEVDWLYRAKQGGYKIYFVPQAVVIHHGAGSTKQVRRRKMVRESHDSLMRFYRKHFKGRIPAPVYWFTMACISLSKKIRG